MRRGHIRVTSGSCLQGALVFEKCFGFIRNYSISFAEAAAVGIYTSSTPATTTTNTTTTAIAAAQAAAAANKQQQQQQQQTSSSSSSSSHHHHNNSNSSSQVFLLRCDNHVTVTTALRHWCRRKQQGALAHRCFKTPKEIQAQAAQAAAAAAAAAQAAADKQHTSMRAAQGKQRARSRRGPRQYIPAQAPCQAQKHPSCKVHMATCLRSKVPTAAPCSGTSTQALKRTQQRDSATRQHPSSPAHPAAAPAPKLEHANTQLLLHWNNSGTLQRHQHPRSKTHTRSSLK